MPDRKIISGLKGVRGAFSLNRAETRELYSRYVNPGLSKMLAALAFDRSFVRAEGIFVYDEEGAEYLDFLAGYGSLPLGHNPAGVLQAIDMVKERPAFLQATTSPLQAALAHDLALITPGDLQRSFFCNSGAEAVEAALKLARASTGKRGFVHCTGAFHGKTFGALSVSGREKYKRPFIPLLPGVREIPFGDLDALETELRKGDCAAFIVEPVQGEAGVIVPPPGFLKGASELTRRYGALLILDEVQTGLGRTGLMFACQHEEVVPDVLCLAKALGGGVMPIGATITTEEVWDRAYGGLSKALLHTSTFGGGSRACAAALAAVQEIVERDLPRRAGEMGAYLLEGLTRLKEKHPLIRDVRGKGLLIGIEFESSAGSLTDMLSFGMLSRVTEEYLASLVAGKLLNEYRVITAYTLNNPNVMRLEPPLTVEKSQIDYVLKALDEILDAHRGFFGLARSALKGYRR